MDDWNHATSALRHAIETPATPTCSTSLDMTPGSPMDFADVSDLVWPDLDTESFLVEECMSGMDSDGPESTLLNPSEFDMWQSLKVEDKVLSSNHPLPFWLPGMFAPAACSPRMLRSPGGILFSPGAAPWLCPDILGSPGSFFTAPLLTAGEGGSLAAAPHPMPKAGPADQNIDLADVSSPAKKACDEASQKDLKQLGKGNTLCGPPVRKSCEDASWRHAAGGKIVRTVGPGGGDHSPPLGQALSHPRWDSANESVTDVWEWKKYGQKHAKGGKFPRLYFRCTQFGCPAKRTVEEQAKGAVDIVYRGQHNHFATVSGPDQLPAAETSQAPAQKLEQEEPLEKKQAEVKAEVEELLPAIKISGAAQLRTASEPGGGVVKDASSCLPEMPVHHPASKLVPDQNLESGCEKREKEELTLDLDILRGRNFFAKLLECQLSGSEQTVNNCSAPAVVNPEREQSVDSPPKPCGQLEEVWLRGGRTLGSEEKELVLQKSWPSDQLPIGPKCLLPEVDGVLSEAHEGNEEEGDWNIGTVIRPRKETTECPSPDLPKNGQLRAAEKEDVLVTGAAGSAILSHLVSHVKPDLKSKSVISTESTRSTFSPELVPPHSSLASAGLLSAGASNFPAPRGAAKRKVCAVVSSGEDQQAQVLDNPTPGSKSSSSTGRKKRLKQNRVERRRMLVPEGLEDTECSAYKWRKYGEKEIKSSHHKRSYFRCSQEGCPAIRQMERVMSSKEDEGPRPRPLFLITLIGDHSHPPPMVKTRVWRA